MTQQNQQEKNSVRSLIESDKFRSTVAQVLPSHLTPARFVRIAIASTTRTPKLAECDPTTVLQCLMTLSQFGLEPDGRNAHLIPFWNSKRGVMECQLIIDYKGLVALAKRSGQVSYIHADSVCENDVFEYDKGVVVKHQIDFKKDRGKPYAYYAMVRFKDGTEQAECMTEAEIEKIRKRSRAGDSGPWVTDKPEMSKKTVFRRLSKWIELSPEFREALEVDADRIEELRFDNALPIKRAEVRRLNDRGPTEEAPTVETHQATSGSGSENTSGEGTDAVYARDTAPAPTVGPDEPQSAAPPKKRLKKNPELSNSKIPNQTKTLVRLAALGKGKEDLVAVAKTLDGLKEDQDWSSITEHDFGNLLHPDNWKVIEEELKKL